MKYQKISQEPRNEVPEKISSDICKNLNFSQAEAAAHLNGPCMVLAGPGSGKTLTIAKRIEYLIKVHGIDPQKILVITFTKYAAREMKERFLRICGEKARGVTCGTFHGIYYGILKWAYGFDQTSLLSEKEKYSLLRQACKESGKETASEEADGLKELAEEIGNIKNNCLHIEEYESLQYGTEMFREIYRYYEREKKKLRKIDFEDMLILCKNLFENRTDILKKWQERFSYILIDEFQDVNQAQYDVIRMLAAPEDNLFVVGDDDQAIYGFRGAKPGIMLEFGKDYPKTKQVLLDVNYRSDAYIVKGALRVISHNKMRYQKQIKASHPAKETVHVQETLNPVDESKYILEEIKKYREKGVPYTDMAVLFRTVNDARVLSEVLAEYQIPYSMREKMNNLYEHFIAVDISSYFHLAQKEYARKYFLQVANRPNRYIGRDSMGNGAVSYESLRKFYCDKGWMVDRIDQLEWDMKMLQNKTPYAAIQYIRKRMGYDGFLRDYAEYRGVEYGELIAVLEEIQECAKEFPTIEAWFTHVKNYGEALEKQKKQTKETEGVSLLTMHTAKGLEYRTVFVVSSNEGSIPYKKAKLESEIEEERRLFYVAMTRAKEKLILTYTKEKNGKAVEPSRFVNELLNVSDSED